MNSSVLQVYPNYKLLYDTNVMNESDLIVLKVAK
jgi:hypothetical protein